MKITLYIDSMMCENCASTIAKSLESLTGVSDVNANVKKKTVMVTYDESINTEEEILKAVVDSGFTFKIKHGIF